MNRERYLGSIVEMQRRLLLAPDHDELGTLNHALEPLARACGASRVYLFENHHEGSRRFMSQRAEWCAPGIPPELANPQLQGIAYDDFFPRWEEAMVRGQRVEGPVSTFPEAERQILEPQGILSILVIPMMLDGDFTGFIGFDHCRHIHVFTPIDIQLLEAAATNLSLFLAQRRARQALQATHSELIEARDAAVAASRAKSTFMAKISHELRTPMNAILGYSEILLDLDEDEAPELVPHRPDLQAIHTSGRHLLSIIDDLLDLSRAEAGMLTASPAHLSLDELVEHTERLLPLLATRAPHLQVHVERPEGPLGHLHTDGVRLRQVLINLLSNAFKYRPRGSVTFRVILPDAEHVRFEVQDTGPGIAPEHQQLVFEPFAQVDATPRSLREGTGLGLAVCRHLCELLGAQLELASERGRGSTFVLVVPRAYQGEPTPS